MKHKKLKCNYCHEIRHRVRDCAKWIQDGKPPKNTTSKFSHPTNQGANMLLMSLNTQTFAIKCDKENWFIDNGATSHITNRNDLFMTFKPFD